MIVVYAQATDREGIDAAIDSETVDAEDARFVHVRQKSKALNLKPVAAEANGIVVHIGLGVVRVQVDSSAADDGSRVVVVLPSVSLLERRDLLAMSVLQTAAAIGRYVEPPRVDAALSLATQVIQAAQRKRVLSLGLSLAIIAVGVAAFAILLTRSR